jgi:predicted RNA-binding Zn-ribbon protein involved in translation (DUF1610 family)
MVSPNTTKKIYERCELCGNETLVKSVEGTFGGKSYRDVEKCDQCKDKSVKKKCPGCGEVVMKRVTKSVINDGAVELVCPQCGSFSVPIRLVSVVTSDDDGGFLGIF